MSVTWGVGRGKKFEAGRVLLFGFVMSSELDVFKFFMITIMVLDLIEVVYRAICCDLIFVVVPISKMFPNDGFNGEQGQYLVAQRISSV